MVKIFVGLAITRYLEFKTNLSIKKIIKIAKKVLAHKVAITKTGESALIETKINDPTLCGQLEKLRDLDYQMSYVRKYAPFCE